MASTLRQRLPIEIVPSSTADNNSAASSDSGLESDFDESLPAFTPPDFTIKELLAAIPAECFERSALRSSAYVVRDLALVSVYVYAATFIDTAFGTNGVTLSGYAGVAAKWAAWALYWMVCGWSFTGIWIIAHECGHQSFSTSKSLNDAVGLVLHSLVLVPYHSWRISHSKHHAGTGHVDRDEVFVPARKSEKVGDKPVRRVVRNGMDVDEFLEDAPIYRLYHVVVQQLFGWPAYLFNNASGQAWYPKGTNHFDPKSLIFDARHRGQILISDAGLAVVIAGLCVIGSYTSFATVVKYYGVPYLAVNHWLVMITFLQHTDSQLPHYSNDEWTFPRGLLATMDRNMLGPVGPYLMHGICETHIAHHLSSRIPHYHAWKATEALKEFLGEYYSYDDRNMFVALFEEFRNCRYIDDEGDVLFYNNAQGQKARRVVMSSNIPSDSGVEGL